MQAHSAGDLTQVASELRSAPFLGLVDSDWDIRYLLHVVDRPEHAWLRPVPVTRRLNLQRSLQALVGGQ